MSCTVKKEEVDKELEDIDEHEPAKYDSDGGIPGCPNSSCGGSVCSGSAGSSGSKAKRRSWKKPKDKPKRPLSAYNIFFKHERSRIVEGKTHEATPEETIRSIEIILSTSRETRRHRRTHGKISFGDLARRIADKWKGISPEHKSLFERYAELDMRRYRQEVQRWKDRKESEAIHGKGSSQEGNASTSSFSDSISEYSEGGSSPSVHDPWAPRKRFYENVNTSFSSGDSEIGFDHLPMHMQLQMMQHQQQLRHQHLRAQMNNSAFNMHSSLPNLRSSCGGNGIPSLVHSGGGMTCNGEIGQSYDQELSPADLCESRNNISINNVNMMYALRQQQGLQHGMNGLHHSFSGRPNNGMFNETTGNDVHQSVPFTIGDDRASENFQQPLSGHNFGDNPDDQKPKADSAFSFHEVSGPQANFDPVPFDEVFPIDLPGGNGGDLGNYLSNLDLSLS